MLAGREALCTVELSAELQNVGVDAQTLVKEARDVGHTFISGVATRGKGL
jgi:hypothetical protein